MPIKRTKCQICKGDLSLHLGSCDIKVSHLFIISCLKRILRALQNLQVSEACSQDITEARES